LLCCFADFESGQEERRERGREKQQLLKDFVLKRKLLSRKGKRITIL